MPLTTPPTETDLIRLLEAKDAAQEAFENAAQAARKAAEKGATASERVALDLAKQRAVRASIDADLAYAEALKAYGAAAADAA